MRKRVMAFVLVFIVGLSLCRPVCAIGAPELNLDQAKELARQNSRNLRILQITEDKLRIESEKKKDQYYQAELSMNIQGLKQKIIDLADQRNALPLGDPQRDVLQAEIDSHERYLTSYQAAKDRSSGAEVQLKQAYRLTANAHTDMEKNISDAKKNLDVVVENIYFSLLDLNMSCSIQEKAIDLSGKHLEIERLKKTLGLSVDIDEYSIMVQYKNNTKLLEDLRLQKAILSWQLNDLMGYPLENDIKLQAFTINPNITHTDYNGLVESALEKSLAIKQKEREIVNYADDARGAVTETDKRDYDIYLKSGKIAEAELLTLKESVREKAKTVVATVGSSYQVWQAAAITKEKSERAVGADRLRYQLGLLSQIQFKASEINYLQAVLEELKAAENWYINCHKYELAWEGIFF